MQTYQQSFIEFILEEKILCFGEFKLKSGRLSPYFFNAGLFNTGYTLMQLGKFYAAAIEQHDLHFDVLFGPAYKGIPIVCTTAIALAADYKKNVAYAFNRKEVKDHGEGGAIVGADIKNKKILLLDDVITDGSAKRDTIALLQKYNATVIGILITLNREERGDRGSSAIQTLSHDYGIPTLSLISFSEILAYLERVPFDRELIKKLKHYQSSYQEKG